MKPTSSNNKKSSTGKESSTGSLSANKLTKSANTFPVVGIGASAGGLDATATLRSARGMADVNVKVKGNRESAGRTDFQKTTDDIMLSRYSPAGVVVNEAMDIVHFHGKTDNYLEQAEGKPSHNLLKMAKDGLAYELRDILHKAKKENKTLSKENIPIEINGDKHTISIEAIPLPDAIEPHFLVLFHEKEAGAAQSTEGSKLSAPGSKQSAKQKNDDKGLRVARLEKELEHSREDMRSITQAQEATNEELQSANEELLTGSEELQSLNEELETHKEELQTTNEVLMVINQEMHGLNEEITEARNYAETIIATLRDPLLVLDKHMRVITANLSFYKAFQVNEKETEGKLIYELGNQQWDIPELKMLLKNLLPLNQGFNDFEVKFNFPNIGQRIMLLNASEIIREKGAEKSILISFGDVTQQKETQSLLEYRKALLEAHNDASADGLLLVDSKGKILTYNQRFIEIWNMPQHIVDEKNDEAALAFAMQQLVDPQKFIKKVKHLYASSKVISVDELEFRDGKIIERHGYPVIAADGAYYAWSWTFRDITEARNADRAIRESEQNFRQLADLMPEKVTNTDAEGNVTYFNQNWLDYTGLSLKELKNGGWEKSIHREDAKLKKPRWKKALNEGISMETEERLLNKEGKYRWHHTRTSPVKDGTGKITKWISATTEIQEQRQLREALEKEVADRTAELAEAHQMQVERNFELKATNSELEAFAYLASHDLQEPLRKIQTFVGRILETEKNLGVTSNDYFQRVRQSAYRMQVLIENLLAFSRINAGERKFESTDLKLILDDVKVELKEDIDEKQVTFDDNQLGFCDTIHFQFRQILQNLITNSIKFSRPGHPPHIMIKSRIIAHLPDSIPLEVRAAIPPLEGRGAGRGAWCHISFSDNGIGFEAEYKDRIFEVFQRLHSRDDYPGTGIGLASVKKMVENHYGIITASGQLNKGATFDIFLPEKN